MSDKEKKLNRITLKNVRLAFPDIFEAKAFSDGDEPAFSATFLLDAKHPQLKELKEMMKEVVRDKWGAKADAIYKDLEAKDRLALHDGDLKTEYEGFEGNFYVSARNKSRPLVLDRDKTPLTQADGRPYAGSYVDVSLDLWAQDNKYGKRVNASLRGVRFVKDGDAFAGGGAADVNEFDDLSDGADDDIS